MFRITLPEATTGSLEMIVHDLQGRTVRQFNTQTAGPVVELDMFDVPSGSYFLSLQQGGRRYTGMIQVVH
jgi:hypothetical protein